MKQQRFDFLVQQWTAWTLRPDLCVSRVARVCGKRTNEFALESWKKIPLYVLTWCRRLAWLLHDDDDVNSPSSVSSAELDGKSLAFLAHKTCMWLLLCLLYIRPYFLSEYNFDFYNNNYVKTHILTSLMIRFPALAVAIFNVIKSIIVITF